MERSVYYALPSFRPVEGHASSLWGMPRVVLTLAMLLVLVVGAWAAIGPDHLAFSWVVAIGIVGVLGLSGPWPEELIPRWAITTGERTAVRARWVGVPAMLGVLDRVGWNGVLGRGRNTVHGRAGVAVLRVRAVQSLVTHGCGAVLHLLVVAMLVGVGSWMNASIVFLLGVVLHVLPVAMQRYVLARIARVDQLSRFRCDVPTGRASN